MKIIGTFAGRLVYESPANLDLTAHGFDNVIEALQDQNRFSDLKFEKVADGYEHKGSTGRANKNPEIQRQVERVSSRVKAIEDKQPHTIKTNTLGELTSELPKVKKLMKKMSKVPPGIKEIADATPNIILCAMPEPTVLGSMKGKRPSTSTANQVQLNLF